LHIVLSFVVYNYPILSLDKEIVKYYIELGMQGRANPCSPFGLKGAWSEELNSIA
tara:strand:+ start:696 stop:860 length:165 start_codon:yes stop_codon:yes gene_type:complete